MSEIEKLEEQKAKIVKTLGTMFDYLGLNGTFRIEEKGNKLAVKIASEDAGRIIGRKGQTLDSLQLLLNRIMFKENEECPHILLDIDGYAKGEREARAPREESDGEDAESGSERPVRERRESQPPRERRERRRYRDDEDGGAAAPRSTAEELEQKALDAAKEVKRWGDAIKMPEMNAHDRRIIHVTLQNDPEITTESEGEGAFKKVVISLKKD